MGTYLSVHFFVDTSTSNNNHHTSTWKVE